MTRKDYQLLADTLKSTYPTFDDNSVGQWQVDVERIAEALHSDNDRFDYQRFYKACGYEKE